MKQKLKSIIIFIIVLSNMLISECFQVFKDKNQIILERQKIFNHINMDNQRFIKRSQFIKRNQNKLLKGKLTQNNEEINKDSQKLTKNLLNNDRGQYSDENDNILGKKVKSRQLQQLNKQLVVPNIQSSQTNPKNSQHQRQYSTNCSTSSCLTCQFFPYQVQKNTFSFQTQQMQTSIIKKHFQICRECVNGYYPYLYKKIKKQLILIKQSKKDGRDLQLLLKNNIGNIQNCHQNKYKVYEANMVIDSIEVQTFKQSKSFIQNTIANILKQYQTKKQHVDILYVEQGSIILDFWYKLDKKYTMDSSVVADSKEKILQGDIISFKVEEAQKTDFIPKNQTVAIQTQPKTDDNNNGSFNKLLIPIIIAGGVSGILIGIVIYFVLIRKKRQQQEQQNPQNIQNPQNKKGDNVQNQHETSLAGKQKIKNIKVVNASENTEKTSKQGESYDDLTRPSQSQKNLYNVDI